MTERKCLNLIKKDWEEIPNSLILEAKEWYPIENQYAKELAKDYKYNLKQITGLYACFSPLKSVNENKKILVNFLNGRRYGHTSQQINKAELILKTSKIREIDAILSGTKTIAFHRNIYNPLEKNRVTVDRHVIRYFNKGELLWITPNRYTMYSNTIKKWAKNVNMLPSEVQSAIWLQSKKKYGINI